MAAFGASKAFKAGFQGSRSAIEEYRLEQQQGCNRQYQTERDEMEMERIQRYRPSTTESITVAFIRGLQVVFALTVSGLYGVDLQHACEKHVYTDAKWVYAEVVAALAAASSTTYLIIWLLVRREDRHQLSLNLETGAFFWLWGPFMCILWLTLFGIFGKMYISENPEGVSGIVRMKHAVWIDLVNLLLWVITTVWSAVRWWQCRAKSTKREKEAPAPTSEERPDTPQRFGDAPPRNPEEFEQPQGNEQERYVSPMGSRRNSHGSFQDAPVSPIRG